MNVLNLYQLHVYREHIFESIIVRVYIIIYSSPVCWCVGAERARFSRGHDNGGEAKSFILCWRALSRRQGRTWTRGVVTSSLMYVVRVTWTYVDSRSRIFFVDVRCRIDKSVRGLVESFLFSVSGWHERMWTRGVVSSSLTCVVGLTRACVDSWSHFFSRCQGDMNRVDSWRRQWRAYDVTVFSFCV